MKTRPTPYFKKQNSIHSASKADNGHLRTLMPQASYTGCILEKSVYSLGECSDIRGTKVMATKSEKKHVTDIGDVVKQFPTLLALCLHQNSGSNYERNKDIIAKRYGLDGEPIYTLDDLGTYYGLTRERVRQIESKIIRNLAKLLHHGHLDQNHTEATCLIENYKRIEDALRDKGFILSDSEIHSSLISLFGHSMKPGYFDLFMKVSGYVRMPNSVAGFRGELMPCWCNPQKRKRRDAEKLISCLDFIFDKVEPLSMFDVTLAAKKAYRGNVNKDDTYTALKICTDIEITENFLSLKLNKLRSAADKAYRILSTERRPMHYAEICREINARDIGARTNKPLQTRNMSNQMVSDSRFTPIGRSGLWGLSSWEHLNKMTIVEAMEVTLHRAGKALTYTQIRDGVHQLRPDASDRSIHAYLRMTEKFVHLTNKLYGLATWQLKNLESKPSAQKISDDIFFSAVGDAFSESFEIPYPTLIEFVKSATSLSESSIRHRVKKSSHLRLENRPGHRGKLVVRLSDVENNNKASKRKLLRDLVQEEIRSILFDNPNKPFRKIDLYREVKKVAQCQQPTFYRYLSEMRDLRQYRESNNYFVVYVNTEASKRIKLDLEKYQVEPPLKEELRGPLMRLTKEEVDIALFELGRIFERKLRMYLEAAKAAKEINVDQRDMSRLVNMINCVVREKVVSKGYHLHILREERNTRAHGRTPTIDERLKLFNKAHYIADLFVRYIAFLENSRKAIQ